MPNASTDQISTCDFFFTRCRGSRHILSRDRSLLRSAPACFRRSSSFRSRIGNVRASWLLLSAGRHEFLLDQCSGTAPAGRKQRARRSSSSRSDDKAPARTTAQHNSSARDALESMNGEAEKRRKGERKRERRDA